MAAGGNFIDTADAYQSGVAETYIGSWLVKHPELRKKLIIATKLFIPMDYSDPNSGGLSRHHIMQAVEDSLKRLKTDYIDLYQVRALSGNLVAVSILIYPTDEPNYWGHSSGLN